jgi:predicted O-methyltransferase YrrM
MMGTLMTYPVAGKIGELFAAARKTDKTLHERFDGMTDEAREDFIQGMLADEKNEYRAFYGKLRDNYLTISPELGRLLYAVAIAKHAETIVEFGMSFGISTIHLAAALRDCGGGKLITTEFEPAKAAAARATLAECGLADLVEIREGDAMETLARDLPDEIDLIFLDGAKALYLPVLKMLEPRLVETGVVVTDNTSRRSAYLDYVRAAENGYISIPLPIGDGSEMSVRVRA